MHVHNKTIPQSLQTLAWKMHVYDLVIAEGSVKRFLESKNCSRAVSFHKLMCEACMRLNWKGFMIWIQKFHPSE